MQRLHDVLHGADHGSEFQQCGYLCNADQNKAYPIDSIQPLPPNPVLEAYAIHGQMNHQLRTNSSLDAASTHPEIITQQRKDESIKNPTVQLHC